MVVTGTYLWDLAGCNEGGVGAAPRRATAAADEQLAPLDVWIDDDGAEARLALPGVAAAAVSVEVLGDTVSVSGAAAAAAPPEGARWLRCEMGPRTLRRRFQLPFPIAQDGVRAELVDGELRLRLPRAPSSRPRRIELAGAA